MIIDATPEEAEKAANALKRALCPEEDHPGPCQMPWTLMTCRFEDLDEEERRMWQEGFDEECAQSGGSSGAG